MSSTSVELRGRAHEAHIAAIATSDDKDQQALFERLSSAYAAMAEMQEWLEGETALKATLTQATSAQVTSAQVTLAQAA
jgi:hypothetical protein